MRELIIDAATQEISIALLENRELVELNKQKSNLEFSVGDIYLGKVKKVMPGLNAAFVDIGHEKDAFLHYQDLGPQFSSLTRYLKLVFDKRGKQPGFQKFKRLPDINKDGKITEVLEQIVKEPISTKGPRLSSEISIPGRNVVLIPFSEKVSISSKIESQEERNRLKRLLLSIKPRNYGLIVRTVAQDKKVATFDAELRGLVKKFEYALHKLHEVKPPRLLVSELNRTTALLRDVLNVSFNSIVVNEDTLFHEIRDYISTIAPEKAKIVKLYHGRSTIFEHFGIDKKIKALFGTTVSFKNGAYLIIEHTEALHVIDVNSGNRSRTVSDQATNALETNLSAADEIARQLRLRDMGGIIVVDFIDMNSQEHKQMLYNRMKEAMSKDPTKHNILTVSKFGLMQITRQRVRPEMNIDVTEKCPTCRGSGNIGPSMVFPDELKNKIRDRLEEYKLKKLELHVHPFIEAYLNKGWNSLRKQWSKDLNCKITVKGLTSFQLLQYSLFTEQGEEIPV
ncbi:MAG: ribonuclease G [Bacteroides sp. SM23_62]|nr:MAG: ribonuclease G [Bacteroides sp. SM23_62]